MDIQKRQKNKTYVYFAYLNNSSWVGFNEKDLFSAASTVKIPLAMALYRMEEQGKIHLSETYTLSELDLDDRFGDLYKVGFDKTLTVEQLIGIMLQYSDNTAMRAVLRITDLIGIKDPLKDIYTAMGWEYGDISSTTLTYIDINLKTLSNMFLALYNASYITASNSQKVLEYLTKSLFTEQISKGVPKNVPVAHKIGVNDPDKTYSDCGIVYAPSRPYLLCVGSVGIEKTKADSFIAEISKVVYDYVINN
jgi:beta-lactamase class A